MSSRQAPDAPVLAEEPRPPKQRKPIAVWVIGGLAVFWLLFGLAGGSFTGKLTEVQKNDNAAYLPATAESTKVDKAIGAVRTVQTVPGFIVYQRDSGLTEADRRRSPPTSQNFRAHQGRRRRPGRRRRALDEDRTRASASPSR